MFVTQEQLQAMIAELGGTLVPPSRLLTAGDGLIGGGDLSADRTFAVGTPGTTTPSSANAVTPDSHTHALSGVPPNSRLVSAGVGLSGGGDLSADRTIAMGTPSTCTESTPNEATGTTHTHIISVSAAGNPAGVILAYGGTSAPSGYLMCDGTSYLRADYAALFSAIGTAFGAADGTHFNVPNLRGRFLRGRDAGMGIDIDAASRTALMAGGNTGDSVGSAQTSATHLPTSAFTMGTGIQSANHNHAIQYYMATGSGGYDYTDAQSFLSSKLHSGCASAAWYTWATAVYSMGTNSANHTHSASSWGGGDNETRPSNVNVNYIIKT